MLKGIEIKSLRRFVDERGSFSEIMRRDWEGVIDEIVQANFSISHPGIVRAWHRHLRGQVDFFVVLEGMLKICAYDEKKQELNEIVSAGENLQVVRIPGHYWHGTKTIGHEPSLTVYFVSRLYDYEQPDEERRPWNDPSMVPTIINGRTDDPRVGKPWDWFYSPHR